jgi:hypothetical protein
MIAFEPIFTLLSIAFQCVFYAWALWVFFLAVMSLQTARDLHKLTPWNTRIGYSVLAIGYVLDALTNLVIATVLFAEIPQELTVSSRIKRHCNGPDSWRKTNACWIRDHLLAPFDPTGRHG